LNITSPAPDQLIGEIQRLREQLRLSEARFRDVIERNADAIIVVDTEGLIRFVNQEAEQLFDGTAGLLVGSSFGFPLVAGKTTELDLVRDGAPVTVEMRVVESLWQGEDAWIATLRNVTQRKAEEQHERELIRAQTARAAAEDVAGKFRFLAESTAVLSASLDTARTLSDLARLCTDEIADWVIIYSLEGTQLKRTDVVHCDPAKAPLARQLRDLAISHDADAVAKLLSTREPQLAHRVDEAALEVLMPDDAERAIIRELGIASFMFVPMVARQRMLGAISFISADPTRLFHEADLQLALDLSARAALAIDNARLYEEARQANQAKTDLLAIISHDLRTPLNSILGYGQLLRMGIPEPLAARATEYVDRMLISAKHQLYLIDELLQFARLDASREHIELKTVDLRFALTEAAQLIEPAAQQKQLELVTELPAEPVTVVSDDDKVRQVVINLLSNAVRYTDNGTIRLELAASKSDVAIRVHDTGIGISPNDVKHVFEPFWQVDRSRRSRDGGTGLGLAVVKQIVELLGGTVSVTSVLGSGSSFEIRLPR
jgi:signal transduction histidine kinase